MDFIFLFLLPACDPLAGFISAKALKQVTNVLNNLTFPMNHHTLARTLKNYQKMSPPIM
jgi:hypothetical protein